MCVCVCVCVFVSVIFAYYSMWTYNWCLVRVCMKIPAPADKFDWFGLVSLFNGISTFVGYLMPKPFSEKNSSGTI